MSDSKTNGQPTMSKEEEHVYETPTVSKGQDHVYDNPGFGKEEEATSSSASSSPTLFHRVHIEKPQMDQIQFDEFHGSELRPKMTPKLAMQNMKSSFECSGKCIAKTVTGFLPFIKIMKDYNLKEWLPPDIIAGFTIGIMQIPQGLAYSLLAELDSVVGLYVSFFPVLFYFFVGTSKHVSCGTFAVVSLMVGTTVEKFDCSFPVECPNSTETPPMVTTDSFLPTTDAGVVPTSEPCFDDVAENACKLGIATALTFMAGLIQLVMGLLKLGFVVKYLSVPLTRGFTTGCAMHVFTSQVKYILGISTARYSGPLKLVYTYRDIFQDITSIMWSAVVLSTICMIILYISKEYLNGPFKKKFKIPIPIDLIIVILGTIASYYGDFETNYDMPVVGEVPTGIPPPKFPPTEVFGEVAIDALVVAIVAFAISVSMVSLYADKYSYDADPNQELFAHGVCNLLASNFNCYVMCVSLSRSAVNDSIGVKTQVYALVSCVLILLVILFIAPYFYWLPNCVLAAIIVIALKGLFLQFKDIPKYWRLSGTELSVWIVTFVAVVILDVGYGLVVGVAYGLLTVIGRTQAPYNCILGRLPNSTEYKDKSVCKTEEIEGVKIYRFENALYYANKDYFQTSLYEKSGCDPKRLKNAIAKCKNKREAHIKKGGSEEEAARLFVLPSAPIHHVVLDCSAVTYTDAMGVSVLRTVFTDYKEVKVEVFFAGLCEGVREMLEEGGFYEKCTPELLFPTVHDAVISALDNFPDQQKPLLHNVIDAPYYDQQASSLAQKPSIQAGVEELQIEVPVNKNMAHLKKESAARSRSSTTRSRSSTNRSRANTVDGYHNPALVVDDVMDLDELEGENNANDADMAGVITSF